MTDSEIVKKIRQVFYDFYDDDDMDSIDVCMRIEQILGI